MNKLMTSEEYIDAWNQRRFRKVERRAADVIETITNSGIKYDEEDEVFNVCQAIQEMRKESERDGGIKEGQGNDWKIV